jgi:drug/metabolite transporter (DMT)-like permease
MRFRPWLFSDSGEPQRSPRPVPYSEVVIVLFCAVFVTSTASVFVRMAQNSGVPSLTVAAGRMLLAAALLSPWAAFQWIRHRPRIDASLAVLAVVSGIFLAIHFASWITSLRYTSVASSAALVSTSPLWVWGASVVFLKEPFHARRLPGLAFSLIGSLCIGISDRNMPGLKEGFSPVLGDVLALCGAAAVSGYWLIGRFLRNRMPFWTYIYLCYVTAALVLVLAVAITGTKVALSTQGFLCLAALAVGPQLFGHSALNWSMKHVSATFVALAVLGEPIGSSVLAYLVFQENLKPVQTVGFVFLLVGIFDAVRAELAVSPGTGS